MCFTMTCILQILKNTMNEGGVVALQLKSRINFAKAYKIEKCN